MPCRVLLDTSEVLVVGSVGTSADAARKTARATPLSEPSVVLLGPFNYSTDMSLYKDFSIDERVKLKVSAVVF